MATVGLWDLRQGSWGALPHVGLEHTGGLKELAVTPTECPHPASGQPGVSSEYLTSPSRPHPWAAEE